MREGLVVMGQAGGSGWKAQIDGHEFKDVEFDFYDDVLRIVKIDPSGARDEDHSRCRTLYIDVEIPSWKEISNDFVQLRGYVSQMRRYPEGEGVPVEYLCDGGKYCMIGQEHPVSDKYLPPVDETFKTGVYKITLWRY